jgi:tetratricopeptide (TPR) repeat protein
MRKHTWLLIAVGSLVVALSGVAAEVPSIAISIGTREYFGTEYAMPPQQDAPFMFYVGEPILVAIEAGNPADSAAGRLSFANRGLFAIEVRKDGELVNVPVSFEPTGELEDANGSARRTLRTPIALNPGQRFSINGRIPSTLTPGVYVVEVSTQAVDGSGLPIAPLSTRFMFELRSRGDSDVIENTRRLAMRAAVNSDYGAAEKFSAELLRLHPRSYAAFAIRGYVAKERGQSAQAAALFQQALDILERNDDGLYLKWNGQLKREHDISGLRGRARR